MQSSRSPWVLILQAALDHPKEKKENRQKIQGNITKSHIFWVIMLFFIFPRCS